MRHEKFMWMQWLFLCAFGDAQNWKLHGLDMICLYFVLHFACAQAKISSIRHAFPLARSLAHFTRTRNKVMPFAIQYTTMANEMNVEITCLVYNLIHYTIENIYLYVNSYAAIKMIMEKGNFSLSLFLSSHIFFCRMLECGRPKDMIVIAYHIYVVCTVYVVGKKSTIENGMLVINGKNGKWIRYSTLKFQSLPFFST